MTSALLPSEIPTGNALTADQPDAPFWIGQEASASSEITNWAVDAPAMSGTFQVWDGSVFVDQDYGQSDLTNTVDHVDPKLTLASFATAASLQNIPLDPIGLDHADHVASLPWKPTHLKVFTGAEFGHDLSSLSFYTILEREESAPLLLTGAHHMTAGMVPMTTGLGSPSSEQRDFYHYHRNTATFEATLEDLPYSALNARLAQPRNASLIGQLMAPGAWLHARLSAGTSSGAIGGQESALYWHWNHNASEQNRFPQALDGGFRMGERGAEPHQRRPQNGPGFKEFPGLAPAQTGPGSPGSPGTSTHSASSRR